MKFKKTNKKTLIFLFKFKVVYSQNTHLTVYYNISNVNHLN